MVVVALIAILVPSGAAGPVELAQPIVAFASANSTGASLLWVPGPQPADSYIVLGGTPGNLAPIDSVPGTQFSVDVMGNYAAYAIESVTAGMTSNPVVALALNSCTRIELNPPAISDGCDSPANLPAKDSALLDLPGGLL